MKTIEEMIQVMEYFKNGGEVEFSQDNNNWHNLKEPQWNWSDYDYRIKEQKKTVTIEKWLCKSGDDSYYIVETSHIDGYEKVKLLDSYEVEL